MESSEFVQSIIFNMNLMQFTIYAYNRIYISFDLNIFILFLTLYPKIDSKCVTKFKLTILLNPLSQN